MKRTLFSILSLIVLAALAVAQQQGKSQPAAQQPGAQGQSGQAPAGPRKLQAKTKEEFDAYKTASGAADAAAAEAAANDFAAKFPDSELRNSLYLKAMTMYQQQNNAAKMIEMGKKSLAIDPVNPALQSELALVIPDTVRETDFDRDERLGEASKLANDALATLNKPEPVPNIPPEQSDMYKKEVSSIAYSALGEVARKKQDWTGAETNLRRSVEMASKPDITTYLHLAYVLNHEHKNKEALDIANKAVTLSSPGSAENTAATQLRDQLQHIISSESSTAAKPAAPPPSQPSPEPIPPK